MIDNHENPLYEYTTRSVPYTPEVAFASFDAEMNRQGWARAWADTSLEGVFIVYRRARNAKAQP